MLFNSLHFLYFFIVVTTVYYALPHRFRWQLLLISSCYFYMVFLPIYILILGFTIVIDYYAGIFIENTEGSPSRKKGYLIASLIANIGVLAVFKYYNFLNDNLSFFLNNLGYHNSIPNLSILLPVGLSFHTFQAMSYTIEVYRGNQKAEKNFGIYALYVMFYPQLVAGPIERPQNILHQFYERHEFNYQGVTDGLKRMAWGLFKKVVIADRLAATVNLVYENPIDFQGLSLIIATFFFAIQIYCDFSGYSDMAIGAAQVMGFKLMKNFDRPYFSTSISEFWKRWHISLSTWFRDYLYISLGGNRVGKGRLFFNLFITFLISGLWHGANWTYVIWGGLNGIYLIIELIISKPINNAINNLKLNRFSFIITLIKGVFTFNLICLTWIFFRAKTVQDAFYILTHLLSDLQLKGVFSKLAIAKFDLQIICISLLILLYTEGSSKNISMLNWLNSKPLYLRWSIYVSLGIAILLFGAYEQNQQFIYFQF
jgi:alginate O-acetyltransferase complex protein AlgI